MKISPSILSANFTHLGDEVRAVKQAGVDYLHIDVMDGHFVPNLTVGLPVVKALSQVTTLPLDVHLMIEPVDPYLERFIDAGATILTVHMEASLHIDRTLLRIREYRTVDNNPDNNSGTMREPCRVGVALNPATPESSLQYLLPLVDLVLVMTVNPGFSGQFFIPEMLNKIRSIHHMIQASGRQIELSVDGGVTLDNVGWIAEAGATVCVSGSTIFSANQNGDYTEVVQKLKNNL